MDETALIKTVLNQSDAKYNSADLNIAYRMKVGLSVGVNMQRASHSLPTLRPYACQANDSRHGDIKLNLRLLLPTGG